MAAAVAGTGPSTESEMNRSETEEEPRSNETEEDGSEQSGPTPPHHSRLSKLPLSRIRALMKADPDVSLAGQDSVFIIARATELFVEMIAKDALVYAQQGKRKTLQRKDLDNAIEAVDEFAFLEGTLD
ncbi:DNA polymerase epsilon subunit 4 [Brachyhypopomus gauderio]|uniref:DNA polymerase epsilon subunit 4 n=1 Tax=Brachyhypopomus gauderio TaxID=698409 RepID=UPI004040EF37